MPIWGQGEQKSKAKASVARASKARANKARASEGEGEQRLARPGF